MGKKDELMGIVSVYGLYLKDFQGCPERISAWFFLVVEKSHDVESFFYGRCFFFGEKVKSIKPMKILSGRMIKILCFISERIQLS